MMSEYDEVTCFLHRYNILANQIVGISKIDPFPFSFSNPMHTGRVSASVCLMN